MGLFIRYLLEAPLTNSALARFPKWAKSITTCMRKTLVPHMCLAKKLLLALVKMGCESKIPREVTSSNY